MFTPQRKGWAGWSLSPARVAGLEGSAPAGRSASVLRKEKGKGVAEAPPPPPPPPPGSLGEGPGDFGGGGEDMEVWRRFREAGLLDDSALQRRGRRALLERVSELERELHEYQYNMGLLLIEKKDWTCKYEEISERLAETEEILKREQASHLIAISEVEKQEENMQKALGVEKQCVVDLENTLRKMRGQMAEAKFLSDSKLAEAHALEASLEERLLEVARKLHSADAKLAEASRKGSEIEWKLDDVEACERKNQSEHLSLENEKAHKKDLSEQREHLRDWERSLQERHRRLVDEQSSLNERELRANEADRALRKKEEELGEARKRVEISSTSLKEKDDDINLRLKALIAKEKEANIKQANLEQKEKMLLAGEEKLNVRERVEIQKLIDEHTALLDSKKKKFELELENRRRAFDEEVKNKMEEVRSKECEITLKEEQVIKREQALEIRMDSLKDNEKDLEIKLTKLKEMQQCVTTEDKRLDEEKVKLEKEIQVLVASKTELEKLNIAVETEKTQIIHEKEALKLTKEEKDQHLQLQLKLKEEIEDCRLMKESLAKQIEDLRMERERFESEWEVLDEKRSALNEEIKQVTEERANFEKWRNNEEDRLKKEKFNVRAEMQRELAELNLKKESFEKLKTHELSEVRGVLERERADIAAELERLKHELNVELLKQEHEMKERLHEKENEFNRKRDIEFTNIRASSNLNELKIHKLKVEEERLEREKEEISWHHKRLEADQHEIQKDIDTLRVRSRNLKEQREEFIKERNWFIAVARQCRVCKNCGITISELELLGLQPSNVTNDAENFLSPGGDNAYLEECMKGKVTETTPQAGGSQSAASGGCMSWLQKCSKLFKFSPVGKSDSSREAKVCQSLLFVQQDREHSDVEAENGIAPSFNDSFDSRKAAQSDSISRANDESVRGDKGGDGPEPLLGIGDNSIDIFKVPSDNGNGKMQGEHVIPNAEQNEREVSSLPAETDSQAEPSKQRRQPSWRGRTKTIRRTRSVKAVVEDAKAILGETSEEDRDGWQNGDANESMNTQGESQGDSLHANHVPTSSRQKKRHANISMTASDLDAEDSEMHSGSVSLGGQRKRRQTAASGAQVPGAKRYNFRRSTIAGSVAATQTMPDQSKGQEKGRQQSIENKMKGNDADDADGTSRHVPTDATPVAFAGENKETEHMLQTVVGAQISSQETVRLGREGALVETDSHVVAKSVEFSEPSGHGDEVNDLEIEVAALATPPGGGSGSNDDGFVEEEEKHNVSIGEKLWTFFTT